MIWRAGLVGAAVLAFGVGPVAGQGPRGPLLARIDSLAATRVAAGAVAGMSIGVMKGGELLLAKGYGYADLEQQVPATAETVYRLGSLTKQFTAIAVLQLMERGKLRLDDELTAFFPDYPTRGRRITVAQLLDHTSGLANYTGFGEGYHRDTFRLALSAERMVGLFKDRPPDFAPGEDWAYTNTGYFLAGLIVEKLSALSYPDYLRTQILEPAGLRVLRYCDDTAIVPHRASGYNASAAGLVNAQPFDLSAAFAAGALCSNVLDLLAYQRALDGMRLLSRPSYDRMRTPVQLDDGWITTYGLGLVIDRIDGHRMIGHGGQIQGFQTMLFHYPDDDLTVAVLENTWPAGGEGVHIFAHAIARVAMGLPPVAPAQAVPIAPAEVAGLAGSYAVALLSEGARLRLRVDGGQVLLEGLAPAAIPLIHLGGRVFGMPGDASFRLTPVGPVAQPTALRVRMFGLTVRARRVAG